LENKSASPALFLQLTPAAGQGIWIDEDYFCLAPDEARTIRAAGSGEVIVQAWNYGPHRALLA
jgi:hypothetical protein